MLKTTIERDTLPPEWLPGVEAANRILEKRLEVLELYDISARWHSGYLDGSKKIVYLDLAAHHKGREYAVKDFAYSGNVFLNPELRTLPGMADQQLAFVDELRRLNLDDLKEQRAQAAARDLAEAP